MLQINVDNDANHPTTGHLSFRRIRSRAKASEPEAIGDTPHCLNPTMEH